MTLVSLLYFSIGFAFLIFQVQVDDVKEVSIEADLRVKTTTEGSMFQSNVNVTGIENEKKYRIAVLATNPSKLSFEFDRVVTSCNCSTFVSDKNAFVPGSNRCFIDFDAPPSNRAGKFAVTLDFYRQKAKIGHLRIHGTFHSAVYIERRLHSFEIDKGNIPKSLYLPFSFTDPVDPERLEVFKSASLENVPCVIVEKSGIWLISVDPASIELSKGDLDGTVGLRYEGQEVAKVPVTFGKLSPIDVRPSTAFFRVRGGRFTCKFVISLSPSVADLYDSPDALAGCRCTIDGISLDVSVVSLNKRTYKLVVEGPASWKPPSGKNAKLELLIPKLEVKKRLNIFTTNPTEIRNE